MSFERFFHAVHGKDPFPWQVEAARRLVAGEELTAVSVPTAVSYTHLDVYKRQRWGCGAPC